MSWSPELYIGEFRPWPESICVVRGKTDEMRRYVPEEERDMYRDLVDCMVHPDVPDKLYAENVKLRERLDGAHMSRLLTENENETLRELVRELYETAYPEYPSMFEKLFLGRIRELGIEVDV